jgi:hypothetical protein
MKSINQMNLRKSLLILLIFILISIYDVCLYRIKCINQISTIETMSNELFMELFEYFDLYTLYLTFYSLNSRFNSIIRHCQLHVNLNQINPLYFTSFIGDFVYSNIDKGRIRSLQSSIPHQVAVLVNDIVN